jgi:hypothetical protein
MMPIERARLGASYFFFPLALLLEPDAEFVEATEEALDDAPEVALLPLTFSMTLFCWRVSVKRT